MMLVSPTGPELSSSWIACRCRLDGVGCGLVGVLGVSCKDLSNISLSWEPPGVPAANSCAVGCGSQDSLLLLVVLLPRVCSGGWAGKISAMCLGVGGLRGARRRGVEEGISIAD